MPDPTSPRSTVWLLANGRVLLSHAHKRHSIRPQACPFENILKILGVTLSAGEQRMLDPETLWRDINVVAVPPPVRQVDSRAIAILDARHAGHRGKASKGDATPELLTAEVKSDIGGGNSPLF